tara:strand:- start:1121 stop:1363 length:243 start_codon:yes stop_codon:yes gene_type:complete
MGAEIGGTCLWFLMEVPVDAVWDERECEKFHKRVSSWEPIDHWRFMRERDGMRDAYKGVQRAIFFSLVSVLFSLASYMSK